MARHISTGKEGEDLAALYFEKEGFTILARNWRFRHKEVDLIACRNNVLHFIEVKTRTSTTFGWPEEKVSEAKMRFLMAAAEEFLESCEATMRVQFDVLAINLHPAQPPAYFLLEDVYLF